MLHGHGDDLHLSNVQITHNFSSNVYHKGCPDSLKDHIVKSANKIENYPSPIAAELNTLAGSKFDLDPSHFLFTNGATEAFYLIGLLHSQGSATIVGPTFAEYEDACQANQMEVQFIRAKELHNHPITTDLLFLCNPNNPDGSVINLDTIQAEVKKHPLTHFIIDEAYIEFSTTAQSSLELVRAHPNISIIKSLTKTFCIPGLRLGYIISNPDYINRLLHHKMPWSVNTLAIEAGKYIFEHYDELRFDPIALIKETQAFSDAIAAIDGFSVTSSQTNYFLVKLLRGTAKELKQYLIQKSILIRDATNFTTLDGQHIRLAVQSTEANHQLIKALKTWH